MLGSKLVNDRTGSLLPICLRDKATCMSNQFICFRADFPSGWMSGLANKNQQKKEAFPKGGGGRKQNVRSLGSVGLASQPWTSWNLTDTLTMVGGPW